VLFEPLELVAKLAALVLPPRFNLVLKVLRKRKGKVTENEHPPS